MTDASPPRMPPRFVPVLTEVVSPGAGAQQAPQAVQAVQALPWPDELPAPAPAALPLPAALDTLEDQLVHRVMQRVDVSLELHLHDAVAAMVLQHTHALVPRLREEIEFVVRQAVAEAVAAELAGRQPR